MPGTPSMTGSWVEHIRRQWTWRSWPRAFALLPDLHGRTVLDLGCAAGDQAAALQARGARVIGIDASREMLEAARTRGIPGAVFEERDLRGPLGIETPVDGVWASFSAAYCTDLQAVLPSWTAALVPGGFVALTEIDDLFGHEPVRPRTRELFEAYARDAFAAGRYDFHMGGRLRRHLESAGFVVQAEESLPDLEFAFVGPAREDVLAAWRERLDSMRLLPAFFGEEYGAVRDDFLACLARPDHRARARVVCVVAIRPSEGPAPARRRSRSRSARA